MRKFVFGFICGMLFGAYGGYAYCKEKITKIATKENTEKVGEAGKNFIDTIKTVLE